MKPARNILRALLLLCSTMLLVPAYSFAVTECTGKVAKIWTGDNGFIWLFLDSGVSGDLPPTDSDAKNILAISSIALVTGKTVTVRFQADSLPCDSSTNSRDDITGVYLNN